MPQLEILPDNVRVEISEGQTILAAAEAANVTIPHHCNGTGRCSTCRVWVLRGEDALTPRNDVEQAIADRLALDPRVRLACQSTVTGDVTVRRMQMDTTEDADYVADEIAEERELVVVFTDLRDFTPFAESLPAHDVIYVLERYYARMSAAVGHHNGSIGNVMGDGLLIVFEKGSPAEMTLAAARAVEAMRLELNDFNTFLEANYGRRLRMGAGLHFGTVVAGKLGRGVEQRDTVIGDNVNVAARIEATTKKAGVTTLCSAEFRAAAGEQLDYGKSVRARLKGKTGRHRLHEITGVRTESPEQTAITKGSLTWYRAMRSSALDSEHPAWAPWPNLVGPALGAVRKKRNLVIYPCRDLKGWIWVGIKEKRSGRRRKDR